jgi:hypothetical protein
MAYSESEEPCPRCGVTCSQDEVDDVFGYRTTRWVTAGGLESSVVRRQSYCRVCRVEHAAELRAVRRIERSESEGEEPAGDLSGGDEHNTGSGTAGDEGGEASVPKLVAAAGRLGGEATRNHATEVDGASNSDGEIALEAAGDPGIAGLTSATPNSEPTAAHASGERSLDDYGSDDALEHLVASTAPMVGSAGSEQPADGRDTGDLVLGNSTAENGSPGTGEVEPAAAKSSRRRDQRKRPPQYRAPTGRAPGIPESSPSSAGTGSTQLAGNRSHAAAIELRVLFLERGAYCRISLLPRRPAGLPEEITVVGPTGSVDLVALQEDWYQDVEPNSLGNHLRNGFVWTHEATGQEWLLSGREIFVLAQGAHRGSVSCPRLVLKREHVVACTTSKIPAVEQVLREAGCTGWAQFGKDDGLPDGWVVLRAVVPTRPVPLVDDDDILNVLRPLPGVEIELEGGVRLGYNTWLAGHPPSIRVYGDPEHTQRVFIDGQEAALSAEGCYTVPGWDGVDSHHVWCSSASSTYSLVRCESNWNIWPAHSFPHLDGQHGRIGICGPLVGAFAVDSSSGERTARFDVIQVPPTNPVLLGPCPGDVFVATPRSDLRGAQCIVSPPFEPVWALPAQPLLCDKQASRILLVGKPAEPGSGTPRDGRGNEQHTLERWCKSLLDANRKGLPIEPGTLASADLWRRYKVYARDLWRRRR